MKSKETIPVYADHAACDGGGGSLGHPKVSLSLEHKSAIDCPYCGRRFEKRADPPTSDGYTKNAETAAH